MVALDLRRAATYTEHLIATGWIVLVTTIKLDKAGFENSLCSHLYDLDVTPTVLQKSLKKLELKNL